MPRSRPTRGVGVGVCRQLTDFRHPRSLRRAGHPSRRPPAYHEHHANTPTSHRVITPNISEPAAVGSGDVENQPSNQLPAHPHSHPPLLAGIAANRAFPQAAQRLRCAQRIGAGPHRIPRQCLAATVRRAVFPGTTHRRCTRDRWRATPSIRTNLVFGSDTRFLL